MKRKETKPKLLERAIDFAISIDDHFDRLSFLEAFRGVDADARSEWPEFFIDGLREERRS